MKTPQELISYHSSGKPVNCKLDVEPYFCDFWPPQEIEALNLAYSVPTYLPGFFAFGTNGGCEMFAIAPDRSVVTFPFVGMEPAVASRVAATWGNFEALLNPVD